MVKRLIIADSSIIVGIFYFWIEFYRFSEVENRFWDIGAFEMSEAPIAVSHCEIRLQYYCFIVVRECLFVFLEFEINQPSIIV